MMGAVILAAPILWLEMTTMKMEMRTGWTLSGGSEVRV